MIQSILQLWENIRLWSSFSEVGWNGLGTRRVS